MREIKFRAWHRGYPGMAPKMLHDVFPGDCLRWKEEGQPLTVMQYTNLEDENGKEIYEGDLVKIDAGYGGDHFYKECIAEIKYDAPGFYPHNLNDEDGVVWQDDCYHFKSFEIIGNIYENPELLQTTNDPAPG